MSKSWRTTCPDGHASTTSHGGNKMSDETWFRCQQCGRVPYVIDQKTDRKLHSPSEVRAVVY